jgi:hypothetical protein
MKTLAHIVRFLVGGIFIFSGLVKLNDPVGTQIKLEEYFEVFAADMPFMHDFWMALVPFALYFSVLMCDVAATGPDCVLYVFDVLFGLFQQSHRLRLLWRFLKTQTVDFVHQRHCIAGTNPVFDLAKGRVS